MIHIEGVGTLSYLSAALIAVGIVVASGLVTRLVIAWWQGDI